MSTKTQDDLNQIESTQRSEDREKLLAASVAHDVVVFQYLKKGEVEWELRAIEVEHLREADSSHEVYVHGFDLKRQSFRNFQLSRIRAGSVKVAE